MNKSKLFAFLFIATMGISTISCSDDDGNDDNKGGSGPTTEEPAAVNPLNVFTNGVPNIVGDLKITTNEQGLVVKIDNDGEITTFDYAASTRAGSTIDYDMTMVSDWYRFYIKLNAQGFIAYAYEEYLDDEEAEYDEWWFEYNANGQLTKIKRSEGGNEITTITYNAEGNITNVAMTDDEGYAQQTTINYTTNNIPTKIENKSGMMLFDDCFRVDMDEMSVAYFAGLLGKATKHLPLTATETNNEGDVFQYSFQWELDSNQMPVHFISIYAYDGYTEVDDDIIFTW